MDKLKEPCSWKSQGLLKFKIKIQASMRDKSEGPGLNLSKHEIFYQLNNHNHIEN